MATTGKPHLRFEATLHRGERHKDSESLAKLDVERLPGSGDEVRVLIDVDEASRLVELGFEVRLLCAHPVRPLNAAMVADDETVLRQLKERVKGIEREGND